MKKRDRIAKKRAKAKLLRSKRYHERFVMTGKMSASIKRYVEQSRHLTQYISPRNGILEAIKSLDFPIAGGLVTEPISFTEE